MNKKPEFRAWYHTLPGVVAAIGWYFVFKSASWIVGYINQPWWARALIVGAMLLVSLGAGAFCWSVTLPTSLRKPKKRTTSGGGNGDDPPSISGRRPASISHYRRTGEGPGPH